LSPPFRIQLKTDLVLSWRTLLNRNQFKIFVLKWRTLLDRNQFKINPVLKWRRILLYRTSLKSRCGMGPLRRLLWTSLNS